MGKGVLKQTKLHTRCEVNVRSLLPLDRVLVFFLNIALTTILYGNPYNLF